MGEDSVVRVTSRSGYAECARITFELPVKPGWKALVRTGEGLNSQNAWAAVGAGITVPWYVLLHDGAKTYGFGVKVQPRAMCSWRVGKGKVELLLDLRAAGQPLELGGRTLEACEVVRCESTPGESMYATNDIAGPAHIAEGNERPRFLQGYTETSNVNVVNEMVQMIEVNRAYEANQKTIQSEDSMMSTLWQKVAQLS